MAVTLSADGPFTRSELMLRPFVDAGVQTIQGQVGSESGSDGIEVIVLPLVDLLLPPEEELADRIKDAMARKNLAIATGGAETLAASASARCPARWRGT